MSDDNTFEEDGIEYGLVMPFVVVSSTGGPYDDDAFAAGWHCAQIDEALAAGRMGDVANISVRTAILPQLDLIALRRGATMKSWPTDYDEWTIVMFSPMMNIEEEI